MNLGLCASISLDPWMIRPKDSPPETVPSLSYVDESVAAIKNVRAVDRVNANIRLRIIEIGNLVQSLRPFPFDLNNGFLHAEISFACEYTLPYLIVKARDRRIDPRLARRDGPDVGRTCPYHAHSAL